MLEQQYRNPSPPQTLQCPLHPQYSLEKRESQTDYGQWEYYKCPFQDCFVCCAVDNADYYLQSARSQIIPYYIRMPLDRMKCYCDRHVYMSMSQSDKNPGRLYLKCPKRHCEFFQWVDTPPHRKIRAHWESPSREGYPRPPHLFQPQPREEWQRVDKLCQEHRKKFQDQESRYVEKLKHGTSEERTKTHLPRRVEKKRGYGQRRYGKASTRIRSSPGSLRRQLGSSGIHTQRKTVQRTTVHWTNETSRMTRFHASILIGSTIFIKNPCFPSIQFSFKDGGDTRRPLFHSRLRRILHQQDFPRPRIRVLHLERRIRTPCFSHPHSSPRLGSKRQTNSQLRHPQDSRFELSTLPGRTSTAPSCRTQDGSRFVRRLQYPRQNRGGIQGWSRGKRFIKQTKHSFSQSRDIGLSQIRCLKKRRSQMSICYLVAVFTKTTPAIIVQSPNVTPFGFGTSQKSLSTIICQAFLCNH